MIHSIRWTITGLALILTSATAALAATAAEKCEAAKKSEAGKYTACRMKAESKLVTSGDTAAYNSAIGKCATKLQEKYSKLEAGGACPTTGDADSVVNFLASCSDGVTQTTGSGGTLPQCSDGAINVAGEECDGADLGGRDCASLGMGSGTLACAVGCAFDTSGCTGAGGPSCGNGILEGSEDCDQSTLDGVTCDDLGYIGGTLACGGGCTYDTSSCWDERFVDNGDGTVTDNANRLTWEKKVKRGGSSGGQDAANRHDADNRYPWTGACAIGGARCQPTAAAVTACIDGTNPDSTGCALCASGACNVTTTVGKTVWQFIAELNASNFAGHNDWRMPAFDELFELRDASVYYVSGGTPSIYDAFEGASCGTSCTAMSDPACSCTGSGGFLYVSTTPSPDSPTSEFLAIDFESAYMDLESLSSAAYVRAVRDLD